MNAAASFRKDYSELVPPNQDFYQNIFKLNGRAFLFKGTNDGVQGYGTFNLKVQDQEYGLFNGLSLIELRLWSFEIEGRTIVCAVAQHFRRPGGHALSLYCRSDQCKLFPSQRRRRNHPGRLPDVVAHFAEDAARLSPHGMPKFSAASGRSH